MSEFEELVKIITKKGKVCLAKNTKYYKLSLSKQRFLVYDTSVGLMALWKGTGLYSFKDGFDGEIIQFIGFEDCIDCELGVLLELLKQLKLR